MKKHFHRFFSYVHKYSYSYNKHHTKNKLLYYCIEYCVIYRPDLKEIGNFVYFTDQICIFY